MTPAQVPPIVVDSERLAAYSRYVPDPLPNDPTLDGIAELAAFLCETPVAFVNLIDDRSGHLVATANLPKADVRFDEMVCLVALDRPDQILVVDDLQIDERFRHLPAVNGGFGARSYAGVPLVTADGQVLGTLCVVDMRPRRLSSELTETLRTLGQEAVRRIQEWPAVYGSLTSTARDVAVTAVPFPPSVEGDEGIINLMLAGLALGTGADLAFVVDTTNGTDIVALSDRRAPDSVAFTVDGLEGFLDHGPPHSREGGEPGPEWNWFDQASMRDYIRLPVAGLPSHYLCVVSSTALEDREVAQAVLAASVLGRTVAAHDRAVVAEAEGLRLRSALRAWAHVLDVDRAQLELPMAVAGQSLAAIEVAGDDTLVTAQIAEHLAQFHRTVNTLLDRAAGQAMRASVHPMELPLAPLLAHLPAHFDTALPPLRIQCSADSVVVADGEVLTEVLDLLIKKLTESPNATEVEILVEGRSQSMRIAIKRHGGMSEPADAAVDAVRRSVEAMSGSIVADGFGAATGVVMRLPRPGALI